MIADDNMPPSKGKTSFTRAPLVQKSPDNRRHAHGTSLPETHESPSAQLQRLRQGDDPRLPNKAMKKVGNFNYSGPAPAGTLELMFCQPRQDSDLGHVDEKDQATKREMDKIRNECKVWMDVSDECISFFAFFDSDLLKALQRVRAFLLAFSQDMSCRTITLTHRAVGASDNDVVTLEPAKELNGLNLAGISGWRGIARAESSSKDEDQDAEERLLQSRAKDLSRAIRQAAHGMSPVLGELRVRVHLGVLCLAKKKAGEFSTVLGEAARRGLTHVHHEFGDEDLTTRILERIYLTQTNDPTNPRFFADDYDIEDLREVKPKYCMIFFSGNRRVEVDVQCEHDGPHGITASVPRVYKSCNKSLVAEIAVACPDKNFDWHVSVESDVDADMVDQNIQHLARSLTFGAVPVNHFDSPACHVSRAALLAASVDHVACRVCWTFGCATSPYSVEVAVNHAFEDRLMFQRIQEGTAPASITFDTCGGVEPQSSKKCAVSLCGFDWDDKIAGINPANSQFAERFTSLFCHQNEVELGAVQLLREVDYLLDVADTEAGGREQP